jgi:solute:Na+ symporter, SSS family
VLDGLDITIILLFVGYAIYTGYRSQHLASKNLEEYFLAGRSLNGYSAGVSMAATQFAADTPLLVTGLIATAGLFSLWRLWIYALAFLLLGFLLAPCWRRARIITDAELAEVRYGKKPALVLRLVKAIYFGTIYNCTVLAWVLLAVTRIAEPFLLWNTWLPEPMFLNIQSIIEYVGVPFTAHMESQDVWLFSTNNIISMIAIVLTTFLYSTTGGLRSVVRTDMVQFAIMMGATLMFAYYVVDSVGGLGSMHERLSALFSQPGSSMTISELLAITPSQTQEIGFAMLMVFALQWLVQMNSDGTGYLAQRSMACRSDGDARKAAVVFTVLQIFLRSLFWIPIGLGLLLIYPPDFALSKDVFVATREATFVTGIVDLLPSGARGLMLTAMLAALASTIDTHLNWGSSYWTNDIYRRFVCGVILKKEPNPRSLVWIARLANALILVVALFIMTKLTSIQMAWQASLLLGAGMGVILLLRWFWWRITALGEIASIVASLIAAPILLSFSMDDAWRLLIMAIIATGAGVLTSLWGRQEEIERLQDFYKRVRPPGFWGVFSHDDRGPLRLLYGLLATFFAALAIFCLLVSAVTILFGSPPPSWFPYTGVWGFLNTALGLGLIPTSIYFARGVDRVNVD